MQEMREERLRAEGYQQAKKEIGERIRWWLERVLLPLGIAACAAYVMCWIKG